MTSFASTVHDVHINALIYQSMYSTSSNHSACHHSERSKALNPKAQISARALDAAWRGCHGVPQTCRSCPSNPTCSKRSPTLAFRTTQPIFLDFPHCTSSPSSAIDVSSPLQLQAPTGAPPYRARHAQAMTNTLTGNTDKAQHLP